MKRLTAALAATLAFAAPAAAADIDTGTFKDAPVVDSTPAIWQGWTVTGSIGWANQNIDARRTITGEAGKYLDGIGEGDKYCRAEDVDEEDVTPETAQPKFFKHCPEGFVPRHIDSEAELALFSPDIRYESAPIASSEFSRSDEFDTSGLQGGIELGYRLQYPGSTFVPELAVGANFDAANGKSREYDTLHTVTIDPEDFALTGHGTLAIEKRYDLYAVARLSALLGSDQRLAVGAGAGVVSGSFNVKGSHAFDGDEGGLLTTSYNENKTSIGYVLEAFARYKLDRNWDLGVIATYKDFGSFSVGDGAAHDHEFGDSGKGIYARVNDRTKVEATETAIKGTLTYTFDD